MGMLKFEVASTLSVDEAHKRVSALVAYWGRKYGVKVTWNGVKASLSGKQMGVSIEATLEVLAGKISGEATDPGLLLRGQAHKYITRKFGHYLDPARTLEQLLSGED